jgi:DNA-binding SARP family transcriptional activator
MLRIQLLGPPLLTYNDKPVNIRRLILRSLLFYLACQQDVVGRSTLVFLFWSDEPEDKAREHLRDALSKLRVQLPEPEMLVTHMDTVRLNPNRVWVDVLEFEQLIRQARQGITELGPDQPLPQKVYDRLVDAVRLWRGDSFLAGVQLPATNEFDDWFTRTSQSLHQSYLYALERLGQHSMAAGNLDMALEWWELALQHDELNDSYHYQYLTCLQQLGRFREALQHCGQAYDLFRKEVQDIPENLLRLCQRIHQQASGGGWQKTDSPAWTYPWKHQSPFIGRKALLSEMKTMLLMSGGAAALVGESGIGKTRLVYELYQSLQTAPRLLLARGRALESHLPFQPLIDTLRQSVQPEEWDQLDLPWRRVLSELLPEIAANIPAHQSETEISRNQLFESLHQLLRILTGKPGNEGSRRLLLFIDDAHWCDEATLSALAYLLERRFFIENGLLVLAVQSEQITPQLDQYLHHFQAAGLLKMLMLEALSVAEVNELTHRVLGKKVSAEIAERLTRDCGGNPLLLLETLRSAQEYSAESPLQAAMGNLSRMDALRTLLNERLQRLSREERELLYTAALIGGEFSLDILSAAAQADMLHLAAMLEALERLRLIHPLQAGSMSNAPAATAVYVFNHERIREALLLELGPAQRRAISLRVAKALENSENPLAHQAAVLAHHFEEGGEYRKAFHYWLEAAQHAQHLSGRGEAYNAFRQAERLLIRLGYALPESDIYRLFSAWAELAGQSDDIEVLAHLYSSAEQLSNRLRSPLLTGFGLMGTALVMTMRIQYGQALTTLNRALAYLEKAGNQYELAQCYHWRGILHIYLNMNQKAVADLERALQFAQSSFDPRMRQAMINARIYLSLVYTLRGWPQEGLKQADQALQESRQIMYPNGIVRSKAMAARALFYLGRYREAVELCQLGIQRAEAIENHRANARLHISAAQAYLALGHLDESWQHLQTGLKIGQERGFVDVVCEGLCYQGELYRILNALEQAMSSFEQGASSIESFYTLDNRYRLGLTLMSSGAFETGLELIEQTINIAEQADLATIYLPARLALALAELQRGGTGKAYESVKALESQIVQRGYGTMPGIIETIRFEYAFMLGDLETAQSSAQKVIAAGQRLPNLFMELIGHQLAVRLARKLGKPIEESQQAIVRLLDEMGKHAHHPQLLPLYEKFRKKTLEIVDE